MYTFTMPVAHNDGKPRDLLALVIATRMSVSENTHPAVLGVLHYAVAPGDVTETFFLVEWKPLPSVRRTKIRSVLEVPIGSLFWCSPHFFNQYVGRDLGNTWAFALHARIGLCAAVRVGKSDELFATATFLPLTLPPHYGLRRRLIR